MTGTNGHGFIGTLVCDFDLDKFLRNVDITSTTLVQNITKKSFSGYTFLNKLFGSNNAIRIDLKNRFFSTKT